MAARAAGPGFNPNLNQAPANTVVPAPIQPKPQPKARKEQNQSDDGSGLLALWGDNADAEVEKLLGALSGFRGKDGEFDGEKILRQAAKDEAHAERLNPKKDKLEAKPTQETVRQRETKSFLAKTEGPPSTPPMVAGKGMSVMSMDRDLASMLKSNLNQSQMGIAQRRTQPRRRPRRDPNADKMTV